MKKLVVNVEGPFKKPPAQKQLGELLKDLAGLKVKVFKGGQVRAEEMVGTAEIKKNLSVKLIFDRPDFVATIEELKKLGLDLKKFETFFDINFTGRVVKDEKGQSMFSLSHMYIIALEKKLEYTFSGMTMTKEVKGSLNVVDITLQEILQANINKHFTGENRFGKGLAMQAAQDSLKDAASALRILCPRHNGVEKFLSRSEKV